MMKKARILGYLSAINNPINIDIFMKNALIEQRNLEDIILELIKEKRLNGRYQNSYYIPEKFTENQKKLIN
jgi:hypothetical protein